MKVNEDMIDEVAFKDITFVLLEEKDSVEGDVLWPAKNVERKSEYSATMVEIQTKIEEVHASDDCVAEFFNLSTEDRFVFFKVNLAGDNLTMDSKPSM